MKGASHVPHGKGHRHSRHEILDVLVLDRDFLALGRNRDDLTDDGVLPGRLLVRARRRRCDDTRKNNDAKHCVQCNTFAGDDTPMAAAVRCACAGMV